jgi:membrane protease YdiL (CAAX protease family)
VRRWLNPWRYPLDCAVAWSLEPGTPIWGLGQAAAVLAVFVVILAVGLPVVAALHPPGIVFSVVTYAALAGGLAIIGGPIARRAGGWAAAFGWGRPRLADTGQILLFALIGLGARLVAGGVTLAIFPQLRHEKLSNLHLSGLSTTMVVLAIVIAVLVGPPIEELMFRGLILRAGMRRVGFLPAALVGSLIFGACHGWEEHTAAGAVFLAVNTAAFGLVQCFLVRRTARLGPAIAVHGLSNLIAAVGALATGSILLAT